MKRLREVFPNACAMVYERDERSLHAGAAKAPPIAAADPIEVIGGFLALVRDEVMSDHEREIVEPRLHELRQSEATI